MAEKVVLKFDAQSAELNKEFISKIDLAIVNSVCRTLKCKTDRHLIEYVISVTSDKIIKLYDMLLQAGIEFSENYTSIVHNASTQYSVFREIELELRIENKLESEISKHAFKGLNLPFVAL